MKGRACRRALALAGVFCLAAARVPAAPDPEDGKPANETLADQQHHRLSRMVLRGAQGVNSLFSDLFRDEDEREATLVRRFYGDRMSAYDVEGSHIRLTPRATWTSTSDFDISTSFSMRLRLAEISRRLQLFADSYDTSHETVEEIFSDRYRRQLDEERSKGATGGLTYLFTDRLERSLSMSGGMRFRPAPTPRLRTDGRLKTDWGAWEAAIRQRVFWDAEDGFGERTQLAFNRPIREAHRLHFQSTATWSELSQGVDWGQTASFHAHIDPRRNASLRLGARGHTHPSAVADQYMARIYYGQRLFRDWLYVEIETGTDFHREDAFKTTPVIGLRADIWVGSY